MIENACVRGIDVLDELNEYMSSMVEDLFENEAASVEAALGKGKLCVHVAPPHEYAVVEPQRFSVDAIGTSGMNETVAVFFASTQTGRVGCTQLCSEAIVPAALSLVVSQVAIVSEFAMSNGANRLNGYESAPSSSACGNSAHTSSKRSRGGPILDVFIVGGFEDKQGTCERIIRCLLNQLMKMDYRFSIKVLCAGLLNDSHHNGNEEDKEKVQGPLIHSCVLKLDVEENRMIYRLIPVVEFEPKFRGPALPLRHCRTFCTKTNAGNQSCELVRFLTSTYCLDSGCFQVQPFKIDCLDRQSISVLIHMAKSDPVKFCRLVSPLGIPNAEREVFVSSAVEMLRYMDHNGQKWERFFEDGKHPLYFAQDKDSKHIWTPCNAKKRRLLEVPAFRDRKIDHPHEAVAGTRR